MKTPVKIFTVFLIILILAASYCFFASYQKSLKKQKTEKIKASNSAFITKALEEFEKDPNAKASSVSQKIVEELNKSENKKTFYTFDPNCKKCNSVEYDDELTIITITTNDKEGNLVSRTVIKPPSFVTYEKEEK